MYTTQVPDTNIRVKVGVGVIITDRKGKILLERRQDCGMWGLPGGGVEPGESILQTALREVYEETGLEVRITGLVGIYSDPSEGRIVTYPDNGDVVQLCDAILTADILSGNLTISEESLELKFFNSKFLPPDIAPPALRPIHDFIEGKIGVFS